MAKLKFTKTELKNQQDNKKQFERFLPTLQLKKQQLQLEVRQSADALEANLEAQKLLKQELAVCIAFFGDPDTAGFIASKVEIKEVITGTANIAGINIPTFDHVEFVPVELDLMATDWYVDDAVDALKRAAELKEELFNLRFRHATGQLENPVSLRNCRREIARVQTIIRQKELKA